MAKGYIKLHRAIKDCWIWQEDEPFTKRDAWIDLLLSANHADKKILFEGKLRTIHAGQFLTSLVKLSERWKWDRKRVRKFLDILEGDNMISTDRTAHGTTITIINWGKYQGDGTTEGTADGQHMGQQWDNSRDTNKNDKECIKNEKNNKVAMRYSDDDALNDAIKDFIEHRRKLRKPMTDKAIELLINKLNKLAPNNSSEKVELINTAIESGWQTVYPRKKDVPEKNSNLRELEAMYLGE